MFDPIFTDTVAGVVSGVVNWLLKLPLPPGLKIVLAIIAGLLLIIKSVGKIRSTFSKLEPASPPISDGQTADDLKNVPAQQGPTSNPSDPTNGMG